MVDNPYKYPYVPVGGIIEWDGTGLTGAPDLSTPEKVAAIYGYGTWERYGVDRVTVGAGGDYAAGSTGGEKEHTLTYNELPERTIINDSTTKSVNINFSRWEYGTKNDGDFVTSTIRDLAETGAVSSLKPYGQPHNNMPPYIGTYKYRRIA
jgi:hypothetical protein